MAFHFFHHPPSHTIVPYNLAPRRDWISHPSLARHMPGMGIEIILLFTKGFGGTRPDRITSLAQKSYREWGGKC